MVGGKLVTMSGNVAEHLKNCYISSRDPNGPQGMGSLEREAVEVLVQMSNVVQNRKSVITETRSALKDPSASSQPSDDVPPFPSYPKIRDELKELSAPKTQMSNRHEDLLNGRVPSYDKPRTVEKDLGLVTPLGPMARFERFDLPTAVPSTSYRKDVEKEPKQPQRPKQRGIANFEPQILEASPTKEKRTEVKEHFRNVEVKDKAIPDKFSKNFSPWVSSAKEKPLAASNPLPYLSPTPQFSGGGLIKIISPPLNHTFPSYLPFPNSSPYSTLIHLTPPPTPNYNLNLNPPIISSPKSSRECLSPLNLNVNSSLSKSLTKSELLKRKKEEKKFYRAKISLSLDSTKPIVVDGFSIPREHWAKAFVQTDFCHAAGILFKSLFTPEEIQSCTLRGRNGTSQLSHQKRAAIFRAVGWMRVKNQDPYSFSASNLLSSCYQLSEDERGLIEKKVFVERRYQTSRKIREVPYKPPSVRRKLAEQALLQAQAQAAAAMEHLIIKPEPPDDYGYDHDHDVDQDHELPLQIQFDTPNTIYVKEEYDEELESRNSSSPQPSPPKQAKLSENSNPCSV